MRWLGGDECTYFGEGFFIGLYTRRGGGDLTGQAIKHVVGGGGREEKRI